MALLILYWSIMIAGYLLASALRRRARRLRFTGRLLNSIVCVLVFLMGLRMGANREVTASLAAIGAQAVFITALTMAGSMAAAYAVRRLLGIDRRGRPAGSALRQTPGEGQAAGQTDLNSVRSSLLIFGMAAAGMVCGYLLLLRPGIRLEAFFAVSDLCMTVSLCILLGAVGFSLGLENRLGDMLRGAGPAVVLVPLASVAGTLLAGAVYAALSPVTLREGLAISAGFGWYSLAPGIISGAGHAVAGAISFLHNVLREMLGIILLPLAAAKIGCVEAVTLPGTCAMDVCLPIVERTCGAETLPYSLTTGMAACLFSALLVPLFMGV
ncbi:lysine exporter LysO family protein [Dysosmobacter sp.]|uniref:lysine exporter LysO family protein n=1 Tax=Dysosmobacter sp. TaxID=2591382 RepID=UPI002A88DB15|nr:lysine exporter LysO family protein [Dysosmobacter sp.]MDY3281770.1 lysine exporter LysO family protein [Dysosmobacter sp.]